MYFQWTLEMIVGAQPPNLCVKCYDIITSSAKRGNTSIVPILWIPHSNDCTTCELRAAKSKDGRTQEEWVVVGHQKRVWRRSPQRISLSLILVNRFLSVSKKRYHM